MTPEAAAAALPMPPAVEPAGTGSRLWLEESPLSTRLKREGPLLVLVLVVLGLSFAMPAMKTRGLWPGIPCIFYKVTHVPCLTCGLTRSFASVGRGDLSNAFYMHLLGPVLFAITGLFGIYLATSLASGYRIRFHLAKRTRRIVAWSVLGVFAACWLVKIFFMRGSW
ncbi:MAG: DUF2752 domain-containing protein [Actinomycetota bacterium]